MLLASFINNKNAKIKNNIMYLILQSTYTDIELALFKDGTQKDKHTISKTDATSLLIPTIDIILKDNSLELKDLEFIGINQGPAPFTTLRVVVATVNGLAFATGVPLVGADGLSAILKETDSANAIAVLNAFSKDVYYAYQDKKGCKNIDELLTYLATEKQNVNLFFVGNGATLYKDKILEKFPNSQIDEKLDYCNLKSIAEICFDKFNRKEGISNKLKPMYLKSAI